MSNDRNNAGFTLVEMLVALTIIMGILTMVYGSFKATTRSIDASRARLGCAERASFALRLMTRQIRCAYAPAPSPPDSQAAGDDLERLITAPGTSPRAPSALFRGNSHDPRGEVLSFVTGSGLGAGPDAPRGLVRVTYLYDRASSTLSITRRSQDDAPDGTLNPKRSDVLLRNVNGLELRFHDGRQWQQTWDVAQRHALPRAVRVEIAVADEAGRPHALRTTVPIVQEMHPLSNNTKRAVAAGQP